MRIFWINYHKLARLQIYIYISHFGIECAIRFSIISLCLICYIFQSFPAYTLFTLQQYMHINILPMYLQRLANSIYSFSLYIVHIQVIPVNYHTSKFHMKQIMRLHIVKQDLK